MESPHQDSGELDMKGDWNRRAQEKAEFYIASSHDASGAVFDESGKRDVGYLFLDLNHLLGPHVTVLDIGCGIGRMDRHVAPQVGHLHGIDVSGEMVARARTRLASLNNVTFHEGDGWRLKPFPDASLDLVFSHIVFQHTPRQVTRSYFQEAHRVLRPGGHFLFQMPESNPRTPPDPEDLDTWEMRFWSEAEVRTALDEVGFQSREIRRFAAGDPETPFYQMRILAQRPGTTA